MKKQLVLIAFLLAAVAGFSQVSKSDAAGFFVRNPISKISKITIESLPDPVHMERDAMVTWSAADIVSITPMESGLSVIIKYDDWNKEKFFPYASIRAMLVAGDNSLVISLKR